MAVDSDALADMGAKALDQLTRYLGGSPSRAEAFEAPGVASSIQILTFRNVFAGCTTLASLGYGRLSLAPTGRFTEVVLCSTVATDDIAMLLARSLFAAATSDIVVEPGVSLGGLELMAPQFASSTQKSALYFTDPFPFPSEFASFRGDNGNMHGRILLAIPIARAEHEFLKSDGPEALEDLFDRLNIDPFDASRAPVLSA
jgi:hypothetical protein